LEGKNEKELGFRSFEDDPYGYLVDYLERKELAYFEGKLMAFLDFKLYFLRTLYIWSQVLNGDTNLTFLDFVDNIKCDILKA